MLSPSPWDICHTSTLSDEMALRCTAYCFMAVKTSASVFSWMSASAASTSFLTSSSRQFIRYDVTAFCGMSTDAL